MSKELFDKYRKIWGKIYQGRDKMKSSKNLFIEIHNRIEEQKIVNILVNYEKTYN